MRYIRNKILFSVLAISFFFVSCGKDYKDDIDKLNSTHTSIEKRVTSLESQVTQINFQLSQLSVLATAVEQGFYITQVKTTATGYELTLNNGRVIVLQNGPDNMLTPMPAVSMTQISGLYFWTLNGILLTGADGKPVSTNGKAPIVRYDYTIMQWVISVDGGTTFQNVDEIASVVLNDTVLMQVINNYVRQHSTLAIRQEVLYQIISTYIQKNYAQLFNIKILDEVVVNYVNQRYTRIFSYELMEKIFKQYNYEYMTSQIKVDALVNVIVNFIREHKEIFVDNEVLYEIISSYIQVNKTTIFTNELLLEVINNFLQNNENFIDVEILTQVVNNYIDQHKEVVFNTEMVKNVIMEYVRRNYVKLFSQEILVQVLNTYVTKNSTTIFNRTIIEEVINNYVQNNYTTIFDQKTIVELINNYLKVNSTTILKREVLIDVITNYFEKNYNLFIDRTVITRVINDYIEKHKTTIISVEIIEKIVSNYLEQYYVEIFTVDLLNEIVVNYFETNKQVFTEYINENVGIIRDVKVTDDFCTITLKGGNEIKLVVYDAMARLRDRVQSIVIMPNSNGHVEELKGINCGFFRLDYLVTPASMAQVIQTKYYAKEISLELVVTDAKGNISRITAYEPYAKGNGILNIGATTSSYGSVKAVALHVMETKTGGTDIMTEFTLVDTEKKQGYLECPDDNHPHMIDLGLPSGTLWACCNVGAKLPTNVGSYFAWAETIPKNEYSWQTYLYSNKWPPDEIEGKAYYDVATASWGDSWQMPTIKQMQELVEHNAGYSFIYSSPIVTWGSRRASPFPPYALKIKGENGGHIILCFSSYWSSTMADPHDYFNYEEGYRLAWNMFCGRFIPQGHIGDGYGKLETTVVPWFTGCPVRPVAAP